LGTATLKLPYDPIKDFAPVSQLSTGQLIIVTNPKMPFKTLSELVSYAKTNPGKLNFGTSAVTTRLVGEQLKNVAGIDMVYVPYKGAVELVKAVSGGEIELVIDGTPLYVPQVKEGRLRAIATTGPSRLFGLPDTPVVRELGYPQLEARQNGLPIAGGLPPRYRGLRGKPRRATR
jgi:tripartite-type tricarboxylate transporter receptor subunit TctC